jgi:uncharacterized membrane protein YqjE
MAHQTVPIRFKRASTQTLGWNNLLRLSTALIDPLTLVLSVLVSAYLVKGEITPNFLILALLVFAMTLPGNARLRMSLWELARSILLGWLMVALFSLGVGVLLATLLIVAVFWESHRLLAMAALACLFLTVGVATAAMAMHKTKTKPRIFTSSLLELFKDREHLDQSRRAP